MLEFCPEVLGGDVILPRTTGRGRRAAAAAAAVHQRRLCRRHHRVDRGAADGRRARPTRLAAARPGGRGRHAALHPGQAAARAENTIEPFTRFALEGRRSLAKFVLFDHAERDAGASRSSCARGATASSFSSRRRVRASRSSSAPSSTCSSRSSIEDYSAGSTVYLINYDISLPSVRRALAGPEWLPRARLASSTPPACARGWGPWRPSPWRRGTARARASSSGVARCTISLETSRMQSGGRRGRCGGCLQLHHQALLAARHREVALGQQPRVERARRAACASSCR